MLGRTDAELVEAARHGDVSSFGELYRRHYAAAVAIAFCALSDYHLAEDAAQGVRKPPRSDCRPNGPTVRPEKRLARWADANIVVRPAPWALEGLGERPGLRPVRRCRRWNKTGLDSALRSTPNSATFARPTRKDTL